MATMTIKKEIPIDFEVVLTDKCYSFNLREEIALRSDVRDGNIQRDCWASFEPIRVKEEQILLFASHEGQWKVADEKIQKAYKEYLAEKALL